MSNTVLAKSKFIKFMEIIQKGHRLIIQQLQLQAKHKPLRKTYPVHYIFRSRRIIIIYLWGGGGGGKVHRLFFLGILSKF